MAGNLTGLVTDPQFQQLSPDEQRQSLSRVTGDSSFSTLSDTDLGSFISRVGGSSGSSVPPIIANAAKPAGGAGGSWDDALSQPDWLRTANETYASNPNDPMLTRIGKSFGRTAMMIPNLMNAATAGPTAEEKSEGYAPDNNLGADIYDRAIALPAKHVVMDPSAQAYEHVDALAHAQDARAAAKGVPVPTSAKVAEGLGKGLAAIPLVGPFALSEGEQAAKGDVAGTITDIATVAALPEAARATSEYGEVAAPLRGPLKSMGVGLSPTEKLVKAGGPSVNDLKFPRTLDTAEQRLVDQDRVSPIRSVQDLADAAHNAAKQVWTNEIDPQISRHAAQVIDGRVVAQRIVDNVGEGTADLFPKEADDALNFAASLERDIPLPKANEYLKTLNAKLEGFYKMSPEARQASRVTDGQMQAYESAADGLRDQIYSKLNALGENDPQGLRRQYGSLKNIERVFNKRAIVVGRQAPLTIPQVLATAGGVSEAAGELMKGNPVAAIPGAMLSAIPTVLKYLNAPDQLVRSAIKNMRPSRAPLVDDPTTSALRTSATVAAGVPQNDTLGQRAADYVGNNFPGFFTGSYKKRGRSK